MKTLIVYDSLYGNTEKIAQAVASALGSQAEVTALRVGEVQPEHFAGLDLLIVGTPTQKFNPTASTTSLLKDIPKDGLRGVRAAAFDTRLTQQVIDATPVLAFFVRIYGYAAKPVSLRLVQKGARLVVPPEGFLVAGMEGPLVEGELDRAAMWAKQILAEMA